jgi:hypothetical protein
VAEVKEERKPNPENDNPLLIVIWLTIVGVWLLFVGEPDLHEAIIHWIMK